VAGTRNLRRYLVYFPYLVARGRGELAATWFSGAGDELRWQVCEMQVATMMPAFMSRHQLR